MGTWATGKLSRRAQGGVHRSSIGTGTKPDSHSIPDRDAHDKSNCDTDAHRDADGDPDRDANHHANDFPHSIPDRDSDPDALPDNHHDTHVDMDFLELRRRVMEAPIQFKTRQQIWHHCMTQVQPGDCCLEFGVWYGTSINWMANTRPDNTFHGFDSFEGLPEDWIKGHPKGHFKVDRTKLKLAPNVTLHEGWFDRTIREFALTNQDRKRIQLVHIDCDLGSSAAEVLREIGGDMRACKSLLLFDEFYNYPGYEDHEYLAFLNFINTTGAAFEVIGRNVNHQQVLIQML